MSTEYTTIVTARPNPRVWWNVLLIPLATFVFLAFLLGFARALADWEPSRSLLLWMWGGLSVAVLILCIVRDPDLLTWTLTTKDLRRGRQQQDIILSFADIESVVIGMPRRLPWFLRWARFHPTARGSYHRALDVRSASIFVRLSGGRRFPLNFVTGQFLDGRNLMEQFVRLHASKVVGQESYTEAELRKLERADLNRIFVV